MGRAKKVKIPVVLAVLLLVGLVVAGCSISMGLETKVNADGSGTLGLRIALDEEMQQFLGQQGGDMDLFGDLLGGLPEGWEVEEGTDPDGSTFVSMAGTFDSLDDLNELVATFGEVGDLGIENVSVTQEKSFLTTTTSYSATIDAGAFFGGLGDLPGLGGEEMSPDMLAGIFQFENRVTLPGSIKANNGDSVEGNTVIWRPKSGVVQMTATSEITNYGPLIGIIAGVLFIVAIVVIVLLVVRGRKKREAQAQLAAAGVPYPGGQAPPVAPPYAPPVVPVPPIPAPPADAAPAAPDVAETPEITPEELPVEVSAPEELSGEAPSAPEPEAIVPPEAPSETPPADAAPAVPEVGEAPETAPEEDIEPPKV